MKIGILTFYSVANFGANLQALSTYRYLKNAGHQPVFIKYLSKKETAERDKKMCEEQFAVHINFVDKYIEEQTKVCNNSEQLKSIIREQGIDSIIIGSDAILQHHPFWGTIKMGRRKPIYIPNFQENRMFPNPFWGCGYSDTIPTVMISASSQNSEYMYAMPWTKIKMAKALDKLKYISVRDTWTQDMVEHITGKNVPVTPDPVFAFNYNAPDLILTKEDIQSLYNIPGDYIVVSLRGQSISEEVLADLKHKYADVGVTCVALTMPTGVLFKHNFDVEIKAPLEPNVWYSIIKNAKGYIGGNMHPIIVSLHNAVPCISIDNWGRTNFFNKKINDGSSKVEHIMREFDVLSNHKMLSRQTCEITADEIIKLLSNFPIDRVKAHSVEMYRRYDMMMQNALDNLA